MMNDIEKSVDNVISNYQGYNNTVENYEEYKQCLINFVGRLYGAILNTPDAFESASNRISYGLALDFLKSLYPENTEKTVFGIMHTGAEGGVYQILKNLGRVMTDQISKNAIKYYVGQYIGELNYDQRAEAVNEYIAKFRDVLPVNYKNDLTTVLISFQEVLEEHPQMIKRLRGLG